MIEASLLALVPPLKRCRGCRLYAADGTRYLDFWRDGGRLLSGVRPEGFTKWMKNLFSSGLYAPYPSKYGKQLVKMLLGAYQGYANVLLFSSRERAERFMQDSGLPFFAERPFETPAAAETLIPFIPSPEGLSPCAVLFTREAYDKALASACVVKADIVAPYRIAAAVRSLHDTGRFLREIYTEKEWASTDPYLACAFDRKGPLLYPKCPKEEYPGFFRKALEARVVLSPGHGEPSFVPFDWSEGELALFKKRFANQI